MGIEPGQTAPEFSLANANPSVGGERISLSDLMGDNGAIIVFTCNHCPYVVASESRIELMAERARNSNLGFVGINSNDPVKYESDSWENMIKRSERGMSYPYLHDETQDIASSYGAERTPEFYLLDSNKKVIYRGRMDDSPRDPAHVKSSELSNAILNLLSDEKKCQDLGNSGYHLVTSICNSERMVIDTLSVYKQLIKVI